VLTDAEVQIAAAVVVRLEVAGFGEGLAPPRWPIPSAKCWYTPSGTRNWASAGQP